MQIQVVAPVCIKEIKTIELLRVNETYLNEIKKKKKNLFVYTCNCKKLEKQRADNHLPKGS